MSHRPARRRTLRLPSTLALLASLTAALLLPTAAGAVVAAAPSKQELVVNIGTYPTTLDPAKAATPADLAVQNALFAPLYRSPGGATGTLVPFLAAGQPVVTDGGRTWTVRLRAGAVWSDGTPITATDVRVAFDRARGVNVLGPMFEQVRSATVVDARTIRFTLAQPVPWFDQLLASSVVTPVPSRTVAQLGAKWSTVPRPVSSGPFVLVSTRGRTELTLTRNARWWGAKQMRMRQLILRAVPPAAAEPLFAGKRLDATLRDTSLLPELLPRWRTDARFRTVSGTSAQYLAFNTANPELSSPAVRRGIALAIDRSALSRLASGGVDQPLEAMVPTGVRGARTVAPDGGTLLPATGLPDPLRARDQLRAGGWRTNAKLDLYYSTAERSALPVATAIRTQLALVDVTVVLHGLAPAEFDRLGISVSPISSDVDLLLQGFTAQVSDPASFHRRFTCDAVQRGDGVTGYCDSTADAAFDAATTFAPFATRVGLHRTLEASLTGPDGAMPAVPLYEPTGDFLLQPWVRGYVHHPSGRVDFERVFVTTARPPHVYK